VIVKDNPPAQSKLWRPWEDSPSCEAAAGEGASCEAAAGERTSCEAPASSEEKIVNVFVIKEKQVSCEATVEVYTVSSSLSDVPVTPPALETPWGDERGLRGEEGSLRGGEREGGASAGTGTGGPGQEVGRLQGEEGRLQGVEAERGASAGCSPSRRS
jgi:hypothetical protein